MRVRSRRIIIGLSGPSKFFLFCFTERIDVDHFFLFSVSILDVVVKRIEIFFFLRYYWLGSSPMYVYFL